jgi:hypothetical protein
MLDWLHINSLRAHHHGLRSRTRGAWKEWRMDAELKELILESMAGYDYTLLDLLSEVTDELDASDVFYEICDRLGIE